MARLNGETVTPDTYRDTPAEAPCPQEGWVLLSGYTHPDYQNTIYTHPDYPGYIWEVGHVRIGGHPDRGPRPSERWDRVRRA